MTENDYSIKPLPNLPNVTGLNPPKGGEDRNNRQQSRKRSRKKTHSVEEQINQLNKDEYDANVQENEDLQHIDYRA